MIIIRYYIRMNRWWREWWMSECQLLIYQLLLLSQIWCLTNITLILSFSLSKVILSPSPSLLPLPPPLFSFSFFSLFFYFFSFFPLIRGEQEECGPAWVQQSTWRSKTYSGWLTLFWMAFVNLKLPSRERIMKQKLRVINNKQVKKRE